MNYSTDLKEIYPRLQLTVGLVGFGVVGKGLYDVLQSTPALNATIKKICIKHADKKREIDSSFFTKEFDELLNDESINVIAELIDDADAAFKIVKASLEKGKAVVSANKKMIAEHFEELLYLQKVHNTPFLYEAACCAGIPIIRNLEEYYDNDMLSEIKGIINGSTNFILTKIAEEDLPFNEALSIAQSAGFAESSPALDIEGHDAANKLVILAAHAFGTIIRKEDILYTGITGIRGEDSRYAKEKDCSVKLVAHAKKLSTGGLAAFVLPCLIKNTDDLYNVRNEFNALETKSSFADKHFFKGKGAGAFPTAAAVLSDISALGYDYKYAYKKINQFLRPRLTYDYALNVTVSAPDVKKIDLIAFIKIKTINQLPGSVRVTGTVSAEELIKSNWWKQKGVSLILSQEAFFETKNIIFTDLVYSNALKNIEAGAFVE